MSLKDDRLPVFHTRSGRFAIDYVSINEKNEPVLFIGDGVVPAKQAFEEGLTCAYTIAPAHICTQRAGSVALAARDMAEAGEIISSDAFRPEYLRPSQAERELKRGTVSDS